MRHNSFEVRVNGGTEVSGGYVRIGNGAEYSLTLWNYRDVRCDAMVEIDGEDVGTFRVRPYGTARIERPVHAARRFTAVFSGTPEADAAQIDESSPDLGLIKVTFTPEKKPDIVPLAKSTLESNPWRGSGGENFFLAASAGGGQSLGVGTGLGRASGQRFSTAEHIEYDLDQRTVIHLRLIQDGPAYQTPVPPRM